MGLLKNEVGFTVTLTEWLKESRAISSTNHGIAQTRFAGLSDSHLFLLSVLLTLLRLSVSAFWNINSYSILGHNFYCKTAISLTLARGFVYYEEDFLEVATGVLRSVIEKLVSLQETQVSYYSFFFYVLGLACLESLAF